MEGLPQTCPVPCCTPFWGSNASLSPHSAALGFCLSQPCWGDAGPCCAQGWEQSPRPPPSWDQLGNFFRNPFVHPATARLPRLFIAD